MLRGSPLSAVGRLGFFVPMSLAMIQAVKRLPTSPTQKLLLLVLADCHNEKTGQCNPSYRYIMDITGLSNKAVANNLKALRNCGSVTFDSRNGSNTHYELTPDSQKAVNGVHQFQDSSCEPSSQVLAVEVESTSEPRSIEPVNLVPKSSEPSSHKPVLEPEQEPEHVEKKKRKRAQKSKKEVDPRHVAFVKIFYDAYFAAFDSRLQTGPKDYAQLHKLLKAFPELEQDEWKGAIDWCYHVARTDAYVKGIVHNISNLAAFCSNWSSLVAYHQIYKSHK